MIEIKPINELLADRLKELRQEYQYTQEYVAKKIKVTQQYYSQMENNKKIISFLHLEYLSNLYNKKIADFYPAKVYIKNEEISLPPLRTEDKSLYTWVEFYEAKILAMNTALAESELQLAKKDERINNLENLFASIQALLENQNNHYQLHKEQQEQETEDA
jgi:transcriptional regulator with XRE-family HTH domain